MRKLKMACLKTGEVGDRFRLILNDRQRERSATGPESENKTGTSDAMQQVKRWSYAKGDAVIRTG